MNLRFFHSYQAMSDAASAWVWREIQHKSNLLMCAATGGSPTGLYRNLATLYKTNPAAFDKLRILKLDEWVGISRHDPNSCQAYLDQQLIKPLAITADRYIAFDSEAAAPTQECQRIQALLNRFAPLDVCVLGLGKNGHLGFNEPTHFSSHCHVANLSPQTRQHAMALAMHPRPTLGMTLGMADILSARKILLLVTGTGKQETIAKFLEQKVSRQLPASFLWLHPQVECLLDKSSC